MRDAAINLRARPEQRDLIDRAVTLLGKHRSDFMLEAACERAQSKAASRLWGRETPQRSSWRADQLAGTAAVCRSDGITIHFGRSDFSLRYFSTTG